MIPPAPRLLVAHGAIATERELLDQLAALCARRPDSDLLARPVRVIVASASQRLGIGRALSRRCPGVAGLVIQTQFAAALETLRRAGRQRPSSDALLTLVVRRAARRQPVLRQLLDDLSGGYLGVAAVVSDLLDAGFEGRDHAEPLLSLVAEDGPTVASPGEVQRAQALLVTAAAVERGLEALDLDSRASLLRAARNSLSLSPQEMLPTRALLVHGFADATGVVGDWLETLLRCFDGQLLIDQPPYPGAAEERTDHPFTRRLLRRLAPQRQSAPSIPQADPPSTESPGVLPAAEIEMPEREMPAVEMPPVEMPEIEMLLAPDPDAEALAVARRLRALLDQDVLPESVIVTARDLSPYGLPLRRRLAELAIPFSGLGAAGPRGSAERHLALLAELVERGGELPVEPWLDLLHRDPVGGDLTPRRRAELRSALLSRGIARLRDAAAASQAAPQSAAPGPAAPRADLDRAFAAAATLLARLVPFSREATSSTSFTVARQRLASVVDRDLAWPAALPARQLFQAALGDLGHGVPGGLELAPDEATLLFTTALRGTRSASLGGAGGGVQVLSVTEARARTASHLFVMGLSRGTFPRPAREDPLLPDRLRALIGRLLPDLPIKAAGFDEERYLFAQLLSAADRVTLSWPERDGGGRSLEPSPLVDLLPSGVPLTRAAAAHSPPDASRPAAGVMAALTLTGLHGSRSTFAALLPAAVAETRQALLTDATDTVALSRARLAVLREMDPDRDDPEDRRQSRRSGPYFGFIGPTRLAADPRRGDLWITTLENLASCPWQTLLRRGLGIHPLADPLGALPSLAGPLIGSVVHRVLERIVEAGPSAPWPTDDELDPLLYAAATEALFAGGANSRNLAGLARAAAELSRPYLAVAREVDWTPPPVAATAEVAGELRLHPGGRALRFLADRRDGPSRDLAVERWTDYKTGRPPRRRTLGREELLELTRGGEWLQAAAYGHPRSATDPQERQGRYLFLHPTLEPERRVAAVASGDRELAQAFRLSVDRLVELWESGAFFPRLVEPDEDLEPPRCRSCEVAAACLRRDSGARLRLRRWVSELESEDPAAEAATAAPGTVAAAERAALAVWAMRRQLPPPDDEVARTDDVE